MSETKGFSINIGEPTELAYAENRDQNPAHLLPEASSTDPLSMQSFKVVSGGPSYISYADGSQVINILCLIAECFRRTFNKAPYIVVAGKHGNPCGAAISWTSPEEALEKALMGDYIAVMGGEVVVNFPVTDGLGQLLFAPRAGLDIGRNNWGLDIIFAPSFSDHSVEQLGKREKRRLLANPALASAPMPTDEWMLQPVRGGFLRQKAANFVLSPKDIASWAGAELDKQDLENLLIAWAVCWRASSNTVALARDGMLIGLGCGQQDRIACVRLCLERSARAGHTTKGSVFASDGFFPYAYGNLPEGRDMVAEFISKIESGRGKSVREGIQIITEAFFTLLEDDLREGAELLIDAGCIGGVVPGDGKNLEIVRKLFADSGLRVAFVAPEHRGFSKH